MKCFPLLMVVAFAAWLTGCGPKPAGSAAPGANTSTNTSFYLVHGIVKKVQPDENSITIQHDEIPKFMQAMTMPFKVKDTNLLANLEPGDSIWFVLLVSAEESWIEKIHQEKKSATNAPAMPPTDAPEITPQAGAAPQREAFRVVRDVEVLKEGDPMPNYTFTNELGRTVDLKDFKGKAIAFTFIFTRCPLPDFCPRMSRNFSEVYQRLSKLPDGPTNWHLVSISFDPHYDTPAVLRAYARAFQYHPERWSFVTGSMEDIDAITDQFELVIMKRGEEWDHKMRTVVVDATGRIQKILWGNEWKPEALVEELVKAAQLKQAVGEPGSEG